MRTAITGAILFGVVALAGCAHRNADGYQDLPHVIRIESMPTGAQMTIVGRKLFYTLPADIELKLRPDEMIHVRLEGYHTFRGRLSELPKSSLDTYFVKLSPIEE